MKDCSCNECIAACKANPGWLSPSEAKAAIEAGYASHLMRDWLDPDDAHGIDERIYVLAPASDGCGGRDAPEPTTAEIFLALIGKWNKGRCVFLQENELCGLHDSGFKPKQCRESVICRREGPDNYEMARLWDTPEGRETLKLWTSKLEGQTAATG